MTVLQKIAWLNLAVLAVVAISFVLLIPERGLAGALNRLALSSILFAAAWGALAVVQALKRLRRRIGGGGAEVEWDEREEAVYYKAAAWGFAASWIFIVLGIAWFLTRYMELGAEGVTASELARVLGIGFLVLVAAFSLTVLAAERADARADG